MATVITVPKKPVRRGVEIAGVAFVFVLRPDGTISLRAKNHSRTHVRHLAEVFPRLMREHGLVPQAPAELLGVTLPPTQIYTGRNP